MKPKYTHDIMQIAEISAECVEELQKKLSNVDLIATTDQLLDVAAKVITDPDSAVTLMERLLSLYHAASRRGVAPGEILDESLDVEFESVEETEKYQLGIRNLRHLAEITQIECTSKSLELIYDRDNLLQRTRIMTDVRPLFSKDALSVLGCVVSHTLRISYDTAGNSRELSLAVDEADIKSLIVDCERALKKVQTAKKSICVKADLPTLNTQVD